MKTAIRYYTKFGHSKQMAEAIAEVTGTTAAAVDTPLEEPVDILFLGAGVMLGKVNGAVKQFIESLSPDGVKNVVCFGSCAIIDSPVPQMRKMLEDKGISCDSRSFTCKGSMGPIHSGHPNQEDLENLKEFARQIMKIENEN